MKSAIHTAIVSVMLIALIVGVIYVYGMIHASNRKSCDQKGGHIITLYRNDVCVSNDGRILESY